MKKSIKGNICRVSHVNAVKRKYGSTSKRFLRL